MSANVHELPVRVQALSLNLREQARERGRRSYLVVPVGAICSNICFPDMEKLVTLALQVTDAVGRFRAVLTRAGYTEEGLLDTLGAVSLPRYKGQGTRYFRHLTRRGRPLDTLIRLFLLGLPEEREAAQQAVAPVPLMEWHNAGLLELDGARVQGCVRLIVFRGLLLACDYDDLPGGAFHPDAVMGITTSTQVLADFTIRQAVDSTLDIGTGNGVHAFLAAGHSRQVCGVDLNLRAIAFARLNAALNGVGAIEWLGGNSFEPVKGRKFDLIVSNPPFAISPDHRYAYRDGGMAGDCFARTLIRAGAEALQEGGHLQMLCDWAHLSDRDWQERLATWFEGTGCDAWVLRMEVRDAGDYANAWIRDTQHATDEECDRAFEQWMAYYRSERIAAVGTGMVTLHKNGRSDPWVRIEDVPERGHGCGEAVFRGFSLYNYVREVSDDQLLAARLRVAKEARLGHDCGWESSSWQIQSSRIRLASGLQFESSIDLRLAGMVARCDGRRQVREILEAMAQSLGTDLVRIQPNCLALLRQLIERGFVLPTEEPGLIAEDGA